MQIIVIPDRLARARTLTVSTRHLMASMMIALMLLRALLADASAWEMASFESAEEAPAGVAGLGLMPQTS